MGMDYGYTPFCPDLSLLLHQYLCGLTIHVLWLILPVAESQAGDHGLAVVIVACIRHQCQSPFRTCTDQDFQSSKANNAGRGEMADRELWHKLSLWTHERWRWNSSTPPMCVSRPRLTSWWLLCSCLHHSFLRCHLQLPGPVGRLHHHCLMFRVGMGVMGIAHWYPLHIHTLLDNPYPPQTKWIWVWVRTGYTVASLLTSIMSALYVQVSTENSSEQ